MDLNHDKQIQSLLCYRYTIGQTSALTLEVYPKESRLVRGMVVQASEDGESEACAAQRRQHRDAATLQRFGASRL